MPNYTQRLQRVQAAMQRQQIDLLYLSRLAIPSTPASG
jgi:hypothetical protein